MAWTWRKARPVADAGDRAAPLFITSVAGTTFSGRPPEAGKLKQSSEVESASVALAVIPLHTAARWRAKCVEYTAIAQRSCVVYVHFKVKTRPHLSRPALQQVGKEEGVGGPGGGGGTGHHGLGGRGRNFSSLTQILVCVFFCLFLC